MNRTHESDGGTSGPPSGEDFGAALRRFDGSRTQKVTAEDVEARFAARRAERSARKAEKPPREMAKLVRLAVASGMGLGIAGFALGLNAAGTEYRASVSANESKIASILEAVNTVSPEAGEGETTQTLEAGLTAAQARSNELAAAEQRFAEIAWDRNAEPAAGDGTPGDAALRSLEHRRVMAAFFSPDALLLTDAQAYSFRTEGLLDPGKIDPRQAWFIGYEPSGEPGKPRTALPPASYAWKAVSVTPSGTPGVFSVVWANTDTGTGDLLAWATARYSVDTDRFNMLAVHTTTVGESLQLSAETTETDIPEGVNA